MEQSQNPMKITLTPDQETELAPLVEEAYRTSSAVFCQAQRPAWPENERLTLVCKLLPPEVTTRLRAFLTKERARMNKEAAL